MSWLGEHLVRVQIGRASDAEHDVLKRGTKVGRSAGQLAVRTRAVPASLRVSTVAGSAASKNRLSDMPYSGSVLAPLGTTSRPTRRQREARSSRSTSRPPDGAHPGEVEHFVLRTRPAKNHTPTDEPVDSWRQRAARHGLTPERLAAVTHRDTHRDARREVDRDTHRDVDPTQGAHGRSTGMSCSTC